MSPAQALKIAAIAIVGRKNSGKTTLAERVIGAFTAAGLSVAAVKHTSDELGFDKPHKDSDRLRWAGATSVGLIARTEIGLYTTAPPENREAWIEATLRLAQVCPDLTPAAVEDDPGQGEWRRGPVEEYAGSEIGAYRGIVNRWLVAVYVALTVWAIYYLVAFWGGLGPGLSR